MIFDSADAAQISEIISDVARTEIMPRFNGKIANAAREKTSAFDIVTDADEAAEQQLSKRLLSVFPGALIIGEEAAARDPALLGKIEHAELAFIIDPIDGTKNFASGLPLFGVMVAATVRGHVAFGAIHDPVCRDTVLAIRGEGAWRHREGRGPVRLHVAQPVPVDQMQGVAGTNFLPEPLRTTVTRNLARCGLNFWMRCAAHEYRMAASGHCHFLVYNKLMPWDHAAGWLVHQEAGGWSAHFDGEPYLPYHLAGGLVCAPDRASGMALCEALFSDS